MIDVRFGLTGAARYKQVNEANKPTENKIKLKCVKIYMFSKSFII